MDEHTNNSTFPVFEDFAPELSAEFEINSAADASPAFGREERVRRKVLEALSETVKKHERMLNPPDYPDFFVEDSSPAAPAGDAPTENTIISPTAEELLAPALTAAPEVPVSAPEVPAPEAKETAASPEPEELLPELTPFEIPLPAEDTAEPTKVMGQKVADEPPAADDRYADSGEERPPVVHRRTAETAEGSRVSARLESLTRLFATRAARKQARQQEAAAWPEPEDEELHREPKAEHVFRHYYERIRSLKLRGRLCAALLLIMLWISLGLPCTGLLGASAGARAAACLVLHLAIILTAMDVFSAGLLQLLHAAPGAESLVSLAMLCSTADAFLVMRGTAGTALPLCVVCDFTAAVVLWCNRLTCASRALGASAATCAKHAAVRVENVTKSAAGIARGPLNRADFLRRLEDTDYARKIWDKAALPMAALCVVLAALLKLKNGLSFFHTASALLCAGAGAAVFIAVPLPQYLTAKKLRRRGAALAGWSGCKAAGLRPNIIIGDQDVFPPGNFAFADEDSLWIINDMPKELVYGITAGVFTATGNGLAPLFQKLCRTTKNCPVLPPEELRLQEGGGIFCRVNGDYVIIGSESFMTHVVKIQPPLHMKLQNAICVAINNEFTAAFNIKYRADKTVSEALLGLLTGHTRPVFAVQDFNVTPVMLSHVFGIPVERFSFPSFRERLRLSALLAETPGAAVAALTKKGLASLTRVAESAHRLYLSALVNTWLSLGTAAAAVLLFFRRLAAGGLEAVGPGRLLLCALLCALPEFLFSLWQNRN